jgi:hypothetical protein
MDGAEDYERKHGEWNTAEEKDDEKGFHEDSDFIFRPTITMSENVSFGKMGGGNLAGLTSTTMFTNGGGSIE